MGILDYIPGFKKAATYNEDEDNAISELSKNLSLKSTALQVCALYIARNVSKAHFILKTEDEEKKKFWSFLLNVQPNPNQTASEFFADIAKKLVIDGEVLIINHKKNLYIPDNFSLEKRDLKGNIYRVRSIQNNSVDIACKPDNYIYLKNENDSLQSYSEELWKDYGELLGRLINRQKTANQVRFTLSLPRDKVREKAQELADGAIRTGKTNQQRFFDRVVKRIKHDSVVAIPLNDINSYQEYSNKFSSKASFIGDINDTKNMYIDDVAKMLGLPVALLRGDNADNLKNYEQAVETAFEPITRKIVDGLTNAIFTQDEYVKGDRIKVVGLRRRDLFDIATNGDKLISSGLANPDEIREELGLAPLPNGLGQIYYITKNYQQMTEKGGDTDEDVIDQRSGSE